MKITAISQIIDWDAERGCSVILNPGETGEIGDRLGQQKIDAGEAEEVDALPQLDHDGDGEPGGSVAATGDDVPALRARYKEVLGKAPFPGWDAKELARRIAVATDSFEDEII